MRVWWLSRIKTWLEIAKAYDPVPSTSEQIGTGGFFTADVLPSPHECTVYDHRTGDRIRATPGHRMGLM